MTITTAVLKAEIKKIVKSNPEIFDFDYEKTIPAEPGHVLHADYKDRINKPWKRLGKCRLENSEEITTEDVSDILDEGFVEFGYVNEDYFKNNKVDLDKCWIRGFVEPCLDNFSITFITDSKDEIILLYDVHRD